MSLVAQADAEGKRRRAVWIWILVFAVVVFLGIFGVCQVYGGVGAVWLRGLTNERVSDLPTAETLVWKCVGFRFATVKRAFNDDVSWEAIECSIVDKGRLPRPGHEGPSWVYVAGTCAKVVVHVEDGWVVGVMLN
ncbi:MAG: hypothetical protein ACYTFI_11860 [Planctomycetota bacterium]|jgi:hypothetical protein